MTIDPRRPSTPSSIPSSIPRPAVPRAGGAVHRRVALDGSGRDHEEPAVEVRVDPALGRGATTGANTMNGQTDSTTVLPACWRDVTDALASGIDRLILFGPPGTGKTYAGLNLGALGSGAHRLICNEDMTAADVTGCWMPNAEGTWTWHDGAVVRAWRGNGMFGGRIVADEIDRASGDVLSLLLNMFDSRESATWRHPESGKVYRPRRGFSVVMTTNLENMRDLPVALRDRFPVAIRIDQPHPDAVARLPFDLRGPAIAAADADPERRVSIRAFFAFDQLRKKLGEERAARIVFGARAADVLDALKIDRVA